MDEYEAVAVVSENEKIEMKSAKVVNGEIILTFNENVDTDTLIDIPTAASATTGTLFIAGDFDIKVNGVVVGAPTVLENKLDTVTPKVGKNQLRLQAPAGVSFATGTITVEVKETAGAKDVAGNDAKNITVTATR